jgi:hypothetical protein
MAGGGDPCAISSELLGRRGWLALSRPACCYAYCSFIARCRSPGQPVVGTAPEAAARSGSPICRVCAVRAPGHIGLHCGGARRCRVTVALSKIGDQIDGRIMRWITGKFRQNWRTNAKRGIEVQNKRVVGFFTYNDKMVNEPFPGFEVRFVLIP